MARRASLPTLAEIVRTVLTWWRDIDSRVAAGPALAETFQRDGAGAGQRCSFPFFQIAVEARRCDITDWWRSGGHVRNRGNAGDRSRPGNRCRVGMLNAFVKTGLHGAHRSPPRSLRETGKHQGQHRDGENAESRRVI